MASKLSIPTVPGRQVRTGSLNTIIEDGREWEENARIRNAQDIADAGPPIFNPKWAFSSARTASRIKETSPISEASSCSGQAWSRRHTNTTDFDDLYDATEDEMSDSCQSACSQGDSVGSRLSRISNGSSRNRYPSLPIPHDKHRLDFSPRPKDSPVPPTPPPKIPLSPEVLSRLSRSVPALHAPPSLDGSGASDQHSNLSTPQTPDLGSLPAVDWNDEQLRVHTDQNRDSNPPSGRMSPQIDIELESPEDWSHVIGNFPLAPGQAGGDASPVITIVDTGQPWSTNGSNRGVQLPASALATLRAFEPGENFALQSAVSDASDGEMKEVPLYTHRRRSTGAAHPVSASSNDFTPLSVPSPGGFFSSLKGEARRTWCFASANPPSSSTAENFYNCPWNVGDKSAERPPESEANDGDAYTAKVSGSGTSTSSKVSGHLSFDSDRTITAPAKALENSGTPTPRRKSFLNNEYDEFYEEELKYQASINLDRTGSWLAAQSAYLAALRESNPVNKVDGSPATISVESMQTSGSVSKRSIGGLTTIHEEGAIPHSPPMANKDAMFYRNFQRIARKSRSQDTFLHSNFRFEAVQANRLSLTEKYVDQLVGKYAMSSPERPPYRGPFSQAPRNSTIPEILKDQAKFMKLEKEKDIVHQLHMSMWAVEALKYLNGGRLIPSPASKRLVKATAPLGTIESAGSHRTRALDLGGNPSCGWAWYFSHEYKNVKIYTVVTKQQVINPELKGPSNHRQVSVPHLWRLPFRDNQFDVISARTLHSMLKRERPLGENADEFDMCLKECFRCLKPGGYLEFFVMDSEIVKAGPYGSAVSVEFGFNLKTRGYDPMPTKSFLCRLRKAKFVDIKRAWMFLPIGAMQSDSQLPGGGTDGQDEARGSTTDIASTTGLLGGWMWEQWLVKLQMEMDRDKEKLLEEIAPVFTEGRKYGAGWRCLSGWAMKPKNEPHGIPS